MAILLEGARHLFVEKKRAKIGFCTRVRDEFLAADGGDKAIRCGSSAFCRIRNWLDRRPDWRGTL